MVLTVKPKACQYFTNLNHSCWKLSFKFYPMLYDFLRLNNDEPHTHNPICWYTVSASNPLLISSLILYFVSSIGGWPIDFIHVVVTQTYKYTLCFCSRIFHSNAFARALFMSMFLPILVKPYAIFYSTDVKNLKTCVFRLFYAIIVVKVSLPGC